MYSRRCYLFLALSVVMIPTVVSAMIPTVVSMVVVSAVMWMRITVSVIPVWNNWTVVITVWVHSLIWIHLIWVVISWWPDVNSNLSFGWLPNKGQTEDHCDCKN